MVKKKVVKTKPHNPDAALGRVFSQFGSHLLCYSVTRLILEGSGWGGTALQIRTEYNWTELYNL